MNVDDMLRQALHHSADRVETAPDALSRIRARLGSRTRRRRALTWGFASLATGGVATVVAVLVGLGSCLPARPQPLPAVSSPSLRATPSPAPSATSPTSQAGGAGAVPVYYLGRLQGRPVLYREYRDVGLADASLAARIARAVDLALRGEALDPDYSSAWPAGASVRSVELQGTVAVVDLSGVGVSAADLATQQVAIEQLVWTATAVGADLRASVTGVRLLVDGSPRATLWGGVPVAGTLTRGNAMEVLAPVWVISPQEGDTVGRSVTIHVSGSVFEATVRVLVRNAAGTVVVDRSLVLSAGPPARGEATVVVELSPGSYTVELPVYSEADGHVLGVDDKHITVR